MELKRNNNNIEQERRAKIEATKRGDINILEVMLEKYKIVALQPK